MVADSSDNNPKSNDGAEKKRERTAGQFFHIGEQGEQGDASAKVGAELHPQDYWVCSASQHALKVAGAGRAAFKGADGKPVVLHDVLVVPDLKANLISLRKIAKAGVSTSTDGAHTYKGQLGNRVLWDLHESKDVYGSMWQLPALAWHGGGQVGEGSASQGECNAVGGVGVKVSARSGETDWATAHRRLGHVAMPLLKQLEKDGAVKAEPASPRLAPAAGGSLRSEGVDRVEGAARPDLRCRNVDAGEGAVRVALERGRADATCFGQNAQPLREIGDRGNHLPGADQVLEDAIAAAGIVASIYERIEPAAETKLMDARVGADKDSGGGLPSPPTEGWRRRQQRLQAEGECVGCKFTLHEILPSVCTSMHVRMHLRVNGMFVCLFAFAIFA
ncbi:unnamed protein product [Closterium sp. NIES-54]